MSAGQRAVVRRVLTAAWLLASIVGVSNCCALNERPRTLANTVCRPWDNVVPPEDLAAEEIAPIHLDEAMVKASYVGRDDMVHFTVGIEEKTGVTVAPAQVTAFREAVKRWNKWSEVTRMVLEEGPPGGPFDITLGVSTDPNGHCAAYVPKDSSIRYHADMKFANDDPMRAARAYVHEFGHVFGIGHPRDGGLMDRCVYRVNSATCEIGAGKMKSISRKDAENARDCASAARAEHQYRLPTK